MRHLERTHGISIASMHEHFQKDHFVLIYEITAKMAADIHTILHNSNLECGL